MPLVYWQGFYDYHFHNFVLHARPLEKGSASNIQKHTQCSQAYLAPAQMYKQACISMLPDTSKARDCICTIPQQQLALAHASLLLPKSASIDPKAYSRILQPDPTAIHSDILSNHHHRYCKYGELAATATLAASYTASTIPRPKVSTI